MLDSILSCTLRYLDVTPQGRIIGRFTKDIRLIDRTLPYTTLSLIGRPVSLLMQVRFRPMATGSLDPPC